MANTRNSDSSGGICIDGGFCGIIVVVVVDVLIFIFVGVEGGGKYSGGGG